MAFKRINEVKTEVRSAVLSVFPDMKFAIGYEEHSYKPRTGYTAAIVKYVIDVNGDKNFKVPEVRRIIKNYFDTNRVQLDRVLQDVKAVKFEVSQNYSAMNPNSAFVETVCENFNKNSEVSKDAFIASMEILADSSNTQRDIINYRAIISKMSETN